MLRGAPALHSPAAAVLRSVSHAASPTALTLTTRGATARSRGGGGGCSGGGEATIVLQAETAALLHGCSAAVTEGTCMCVENCLLEEESRGMMGERTAFD